jgi:uncharacterized membrane protein YhaH (DUF805 family)
VSFGGEIKSAVPRLRRSVRPNSERGRREYLAIIGTAVLIQVLIGSVASLRGDSIAWGSLVQRPLLLGALSIAAIFTKRWGHLLLIAWCSFLAVMYLYGGFAASYTMLRSLRWFAAIILGACAMRLAASEHIGAYRQARQPTWSRLKLDEGLYRRPPAP